MVRFRHSKSILYGLAFTAALAVSIFCVFEVRKEIPVLTVSSVGVSEMSYETKEIYSGQKLNINTATKEQLLELPDIGPVLAERILEYRSKHGFFYDLGELREVSGIGEKTLQKLLPYICT